VTTSPDDRRDPVSAPGTDPTATGPAGPADGARPEPAAEPADRHGRPGHREQDRDAQLAEQLHEEPVRSGSRTAGIWIALILGAIVLVALLIFVIQNNQRATFEYFAASFDLPLGVAMLLAAIAGALVMALVGSVRIIQLSFQLRRLRKSQNAVRHLVNGR